MGKYTIYSEAKVDKKIEDDTKQIVHTIIDKFGKNKIEAIILMGGFGRGEGSVVFENGNPSPFHDYDLAVVPKKSKLNKQSMLLISRQLARDLSLTEVTLWIIKKSKLRKMPLSISSYELKKGHQVLYGNLDISTIMPEYDPKKIPVIEATILLYNRGIDLLKARKYLNMKTDWPGKVIFIINAINKIFLAVGESILILNNSYHYSYQDRKELLPNSKLFPFNDKSIIPVFNKAVDFKLQPDTQEFSASDLNEKWLYAKELHERYFRFIEEERLNCQISHWKEYWAILDRYEEPSIIEMVKNLRNNLYRFGFRYFINYNTFFRLFKKPANLLLSVFPLLLYSFERGRIREDYISQGARFLDPKFRWDKNTDWRSVITKFSHFAYI